MRYGWRVRQAFPSGEWLAEIWEKDDHAALPSCLETSPELPFRGDAEAWAVGRAEELAEHSVVDANEITWVEVDA